MSLEDMTDLIKMYDANEKLMAAYEVICGEEMASDKGPAGVIYTGIVHMINRNSKLYQDDRNRVHDHEKQMHYKVLSDKSLAPEERARLLLKL